MYLYIYQFYGLQILLFVQWENIDGFEVKERNYPIYFFQWGHLDWKQRKQRTWKQASEIDGEWPKKEQKKIKVTFIKKFGYVSKQRNSLLTAILNNWVCVMK